MGYLNELPTENRYGDSFSLRESQRYYSRKRAPKKPAAFRSQGAGGVPLKPDLSQLVTGVDGKLFDPKKILTQHGSPQLSEGQIDAFALEQSSSGPVAVEKVDVEQIMSNSLERKPRKKHLTFKAGARLYPAVYDDNTGLPILPRDEYEADNLKPDKLESEMGLELTDNSVELNPQGKTVTKKIGVTALDGFVEAYAPIRDKRGRVVVKKCFVGFKDRVLSGQNPVKRARRNAAIY